ncbi:MAG: hypothetical protein HYU78_00125 [Rhodocyclales bacterium]|nr:hypothetical protein [Rhodocyclales bacterium]
MLVVVDVAVALVAGVVLSEIAASAYAHFHAYRAGVEIQQLSEDYGFGFAGMLIQAGVFVATSVTILYLMLKRRFWQSR